MLYVCTVLIATLMTSTVVRAELSQQEEAKFRVLEARQAGWSTKVTTAVPGLDAGLCNIDRVPRSQMTKQLFQTKYENKRAVILTVRVCSYACTYRACKRHVMYHNCQNAHSL